MSKSFTLQQLTEGIRDRNVGAEGQRLIEKWSRTGLLRGLADHNREIMSRLLENQAAQLLREQNSLSTGGGNLAHLPEISAVSQTSHSQSFVEYSAARFQRAGFNPADEPSFWSALLSGLHLWHADGGDADLQTGAANT